MAENGGTSSIRFGLTRRPGAGPMQLPRTSTKRPISDTFSSGSDEDGDSSDEGSGQRRRQSGRGGDVAIHAIEGTVIHGDESIKPKAPKVIPLIRQNVWRTPGAQGSDATDTKDTKAKSAAGAVSEVENKAVAFGLKVPTLATATTASAEESTDEQASYIPILAQNAVPGADRHLSESERYLHDVSMRPDECSLSEYKRTPVENFGEAMLRGMGWSDGVSLGRGQNNPIAPVVLKPRPRLLGLGATPAPVSNTNGKHRSHERKDRYEKSQKPMVPETRGQERGAEKGQTRSFGSSQGQVQERRRERSRSRDRDRERRQDQDRDRDRDRDHRRDKGRDREQERRRDRERDRR